MNLETYLQSPFFRRVDLSKAPVKDVAEACRDYRLGQNLASPDSEAITFYFLNHAFNELRKLVGGGDLSTQEELLARNYLTIGEKQAVRMFYYLLLICTRESRHNKKKTNGVWTDAAQKKFPEELVIFAGCLPPGSSQAAKEFEKNPPNCTLGEYTKFLVYAFEEGSYHGGYGGKAWAEVAKALDRFVHGVTSAEMLLDTAYTLAHNNGPVFNKGMLYSEYTPEFKVILDVQRAGQIPHLLYDHTDGGRKYLSYLYDAIKKIASTVKTLGVSALPSEFMTQHMDWNEIEKLGSMGYYSGYKVSQAAFNKGKSSSASQSSNPLVMSVMSSDSKYRSYVESLRVKFKAFLFFDVMPGVTLKVTKRKGVK